ncbi:MAG: hypothetical protein H7Y04_03140 [Verrucomicrobia bacterium]|nr:hypothetical protein [Cytophagales bacterium]
MKKISILQQRRPEEKDPFQKKETPFNFGGDANASKELGFGTNITETIRLINTDGSFNVKRIGGNGFNLYHTLITMSWAKFNVLVLCIFLLTNAFFALLYMLIGLDQLAGIEPGNTLVNNFFEALFFSCQTFTSVGYGRVNPIGFMSGLVSSVEALVGLLAVALATGLLYARFARPNAHLIFSKNVLIAPYQGGKALMFRFANARSNQLIEVEVTVTVSLVAMQENKAVRQFLDLRLERNLVKLFPLSWTLVHPIDENSPLKNFSTTEEFKSVGSEIMVMVKAFDDTFSQTVYARYSYTAEDLIWGAKFVTVFQPNAQNDTVVLELDRLDEIIDAPLPSSEPEKITWQNSQKV